MWGLRRTVKYRKQYCKRMRNVAAGLGNGKATDIDLPNEE